MTSAAKSSGRMSLSAPAQRPIGVRTASTMTAVSMCASAGQSELSRGCVPRCCAASTSVMTRCARAKAELAAGTPQ